MHLLTVNQCLEQNWRGALTNMADVERAWQQGHLYIAFLRLMLSKV